MSHKMLKSHFHQQSKKNLSKIENEEGKLLKQWLQVFLIRERHHQVEETHHEVEK